MQGTELIDSTYVGENQQYQPKRGSKWCKNQTLCLFVLLALHQCHRLSHIFIRIKGNSFKVKLKRGL